MTPALVALLFAMVLAGCGFFELPKWEPNVAVAMRPGHGEPPPPVTGEAVELRLAQDARPEVSARHGFERAMTRAKAASAASISASVVASPIERRRPLLAASSPSIA